jgi:histidine kinase
MEGLIDGVLPASPETYQLIYSEAGRLQRLVDDLQELSRMEGGAAQIKPTFVSVRSLIETTNGNFGRQFEELGILFETKLDPDLPVVFVDRDRILQVLTNLVGNALQYTPAEGKVILGATQDKSEVLFTLSDTGQGISPEQLPLIFNRFYRTDKSRTRASGGSGIGLTIAKELVKAHHGRIWAESPGEGKGSIFCFTLPIQPGQHL